MREMNEARGMTFVFSTHDPLVMSYASRVVTLRDGYDTSEPIRIARYTIRDFKPKKRWLSVPEIFIRKAVRCYEFRDLHQIVSAMASGVVGSSR